MREGTDVTVVCYGTMINEVLNAADELQSQGRFSRDDEARHDRAEQL
ncbi:MAG: transketolase C-terminal domain-containing protein [Oscillospiraceae bacterium]